MLWHAEGEVLDWNDDGDDDGDDEEDDVLEDDDCFVFITLSHCLCILR